jgi:hypothetical protein
MGFLEITKGWLPELVSSSLSVISLVCLVLVLRIYNGRPLTDLDLPPYLTLNTVVALIATINSACLTAPICAALMQEMWIKYLDKIERNKDCQLRDMVRTSCYRSLAVAGISSCARVGLHHIPRRHHDQNESPRGRSTGGLEMHRTKCCRH